MRNWFVGPVLGFVTLAIGVTVVWALFAESKLSPEAEIDDIRPIVPIVRNIIPEETPGPEFRDLTNFEDLVYPEDRGNFVDLMWTEGIFRESETVAKSGETWQVLFKSNGKYSIQNAKSSVKKLRTVSHVGEEYDARLTFNKPGRPIFAIRKIKAVGTGKVTTLFQSPGKDEIVRRDFPSNSLERGFKKEFILGDRVYVLRVSTGVTRDGTDVGVLVLEHEGILQIIKQTYWLKGDEVIIGRLLWAGDLDDDGKLDLYFDEYNEKGAFMSELHISSKAEKGKLLQEIGAFGMAGC